MKPTKDRRLVERAAQIDAWFQQHSREYRAAHKGNKLFTPPRWTVRKSADVPRPWREIGNQSLAKRVYGDGCTLTEKGERKVAVPLYWGKRLQDPKYFIWIPTLHTPDSFRGPGDDAPAGPKTGAEMAQEMANSGGECSIM